MCREKNREPIGMKVIKIHNGIDKYFSRKACDDPLNLPRSQGMIISYLSQNSDRELYQKDIEKKFSISGATATTTLKAMEKEGLILRTASSEDARLKKISLTGKAYEHDAKVRQNIKRLDEAIESGFTEEEITIFRDYLERVTQNLALLNNK